MALRVLPLAGQIHACLGHLARAVPLPFTFHLPGRLRPVTQVLAECHVLGDAIHTMLHHISFLNRTRVFLTLYFTFSLPVFSTRIQVSCRLKTSSLFSCPQCLA